MNTENRNPNANSILEELVKLLDIPPGYYQKAVDRYQSMSEHFHRPDSVIAQLDPSVYPQGSFRLGTVIRPLFPEEGYDLDLVCRIALSKARETQRQVKDLVGTEVNSYSKGQNFSAPPEEKRRCWTQEYQDEVHFHMDVLPSIPNDGNAISLLEIKGVAPAIAREALAITDNTSDDYDLAGGRWPRSNPKGYAIWFESRMDQGGVATEKRREIQNRMTESYASIDDVPTYRLKTPLQRSIQLLKRHRDQMFREDPDGKPISIIITTLAAHAYNGETDLASALQGILSQMGSFVRQSTPRIQNPADADEDFADRWNRQLEDNFWTWLRQAQHDFALLTGAGLTETLLNRQLQESFSVKMPSETMTALAIPGIGAPAIITNQDQPVTKVGNDAAPSWAIQE
jgi:hypothetical protein